MGDIFHFAKKIARSKVARNIGKIALEQLPGGIEELSGKIKNNMFYVLMLMFLINVFN